MCSRTCLSHAVEVWVAEFLKLPLPSPLFSSSQTCECDAHRQNKVVIAVVQCV